MSRRRAVRDGLAPGEVTRALRCLYDTPLRARPGIHPGTVEVRMGEVSARYLGIGRDDDLAAAWISRYLGYGVVVQDPGRLPGGDVMFTLAGPVAMPPDPGGSRGVPAYVRVEDVLGDFPANRPARALVSLAVTAGARPHVAPQRSPPGHQYRVQLWHVDPQLLYGVIDIGEASGRFCAAWYSWGRGDERGPVRDIGEIRAQLTSARDLWKGRRR